MERDYLSIIYQSEADEEQAKKLDADEKLTKKSENICSGHSAMASSATASCPKSAMASSATVREQFLQQARTGNVHANCPECKRNRIESVITLGEDEDNNGGRIVGGICEKYSRGNDGRCTVCEKFHLRLTGTCSKCKSVYGTCMGDCPLGEKIEFIVKETKLFYSILKNGGKQYGWGLLGKHNKDHKGQKLLKPGEIMSSTIVSTTIGTGENDEDEDSQASEISSRKVPAIIYSCGELAPSEPRDDKPIKAELHVNVSHDYGDGNIRDEEVSELLEFLNRLFGDPIAGIIGACNGSSQFGSFYYVFKFDDEGLKKLIDNASNLPTRVPIVAWYPESKRWDILLKSPVSSIDCYLFGASVSEELCEKVSETPKHAPVINSSWWRLKQRPNSDLAHFAENLSYLLSKSTMTSEEQDSFTLTSAAPSTYDEISTANRDLDMVSGAEIENAKKRERDDIPATQDNDFLPLPSNAVLDVWFMHKTPPFDADRRTPEGRLVEQWDYSFNELSVGEFTIGRGSDFDVDLADLSVSGSGELPHAILTADGSSAFHLKDNGSKNGIFDERLQRQSEMELELESPFYLGSVKCILMMKTKAKRILNEPPLSMKAQEEGWGVLISKTSGRYFYQNSKTNARWFPEEVSAKGAAAGALIQMRHLKNYYDYMCWEYSGPTSSDDISEQEDEVLVLTQSPLKQGSSPSKNLAKSSSSSVSPFPHPSFSSDPMLRQEYIPQLMMISKDSGTSVALENRINPIAGIAEDISSSYSSSSSSLLGPSTEKSLYALREEEQQRQVKIILDIIDRSKNGETNLKNQIRFDLDIFVKRLVYHLRGLHLTAEGEKKLNEVEKKVEMFKDDATVVESLIETKKRILRDSQSREIGLMFGQGMTQQGKSYLKIVASIACHNMNATTVIIATTRNQRMDIATKIKSALQFVPAQNRPQVVDVDITTNDEVLKACMKKNGVLVCNYSREAQKKLFNCFTSHMGTVLSFDAFLILDESDKHYRLTKEKSAVLGLQALLRLLGKPGRDYDDPGYTAKLPIKAILNVSATHLPTLHFYFKNFPASASKVTYEDIHLLMPGREYLSPVKNYHCFTDKEDQPVYLASDEFKNMKDKWTSPVIKFYEAALSHEETRSGVMILDCVEPYVNKEASNIFARGNSILDFAFHNNLRWPIVVCCSASKRTIRYWKQDIYKSTFEKQLPDGTFVKEEDEGLSVPYLKEEDADSDDLQDIIKRFDDRLADPLIVIGYSQMQRGMSFRGESRVPTHFVCSLGPGYSIDDTVQCLGRASGNNLKVLKGNKFDHVTTLTTEADAKICDQYYTLQDRILSLLKEKHTINDIFSGKVPVDYTGIGDSLARRYGHRFASVNDDVRNLPRLMESAKQVVADPMTLKQCCEWIPYLLVYGEAPDGSMGKRSWSTNEIIGGLGEFNFEEGDVLPNISESLQILVDASLLEKNNNNYALGNEGKDIRDQSNNEEEFDDAVEEVVTKFIQARERQNAGVKRASPKRKKIKT